MKEIDVLINAVLAGQTECVRIDNKLVSIIRMTYPNMTLFHLFVDLTRSNTCQRSGMLKLLRELKAGKRYINQENNLLMKK